jgi:hypothetical protein
MVFAFLSQVEQNLTALDAAVGELDRFVMLPGVAERMGSVYLRREVVCNNSKRICD